ncbi:hypothetical protein LTR08_001164 [Meristemomyces frigidus]|nr:hypothetical protein LTR08_001164 [Meristemomyces frigidus]
MANTSIRPPHFCKGAILLAMKPSTLSQFFDPPTPAPAPAPLQTVGTTYNKPVFLTGSYKSKEIDSGISQWETPDKNITSTILASPAPSLPISPRPSPTLIANDLGRYTFQPGITTLNKAFNRAQDCYPAAASIFVGNMPGQYDNLELTQKILRMFRSYGECYARVSRDGLRPWGIVQFAHVNNAKRAVFQVLGDRQQGHEMDGRSIRTAFCVARRYIYVTHPFGVLSA